MRNLLLTLTVMGALGGAWSWVGAILVLVVLMSLAVREHHRATHVDDAQRKELVNDRVISSMNGDRTCDICTMSDLTDYTVTLTHDRPTLACPHCAPLLTGVGRG